MRFVVILCAFIVIPGCTIFGILGTPTSHERVIEPEYDLQKQQDRKILFWLECPRSSGVDYDVQKKLIYSFKLYLTEKAGILPENVIWDSSDSHGFSQDPVKIAQSLGAGYILMVQVTEYEMIRLNVRDYYAGQMLSQAVLMDADLGMAVWPRNTATKIVHVGVDLETKGRENAVSRLVSSTVHCTLRYLYPCKKLDFKTADEKISVQDAYEMETF